MRRSDPPNLLAVLMDRADLGGLVKVGHPTAPNAVIVSVPFEQLGDLVVARRMENARRSLVDEGFEVDGPRDGGSMLVKLLLAEHKVSPLYRPRKPDEHPDYVGRGLMMAAGPLVREEGYTPRRATLRYEEGAYQPYVVSEQGIPDGSGIRCRPIFPSGTYFRDRKAAMAKFIAVVMALEEVTLNDLKDGTRDWTPEASEEV